MHHADAPADTTRCDSTPTCGTTRDTFAALVGLIAVMWAGCDATPSPGEEPADFVTELTHETNPSGYAPLTAEITLRTNRPVQVEIFIAGTSGPAGDVMHRFDDVAQEFKLPVLGLYASVTNPVRLRFFDEEGAYLGEVTHDIPAPPLITAMPRVTVDASVPSDMKPGMNLVGYFGHAGQQFPMRPFMFDPQGIVRWFVDFHSHPQLKDLFFDAGLERLANGNFYVGDSHTDHIYEVDMLGRVVNKWPMPGFSFHHHVQEMPNGNLLATVDNNAIRTIEDHIIEIDRESGEIVHVWDLNQSLDNQRRVWSTNSRDWVHANGLQYDPNDDTIIVSGRLQGTVKVRRDNTVVWLLAPHRGWQTGGNGADLKEFLLQPLDADGQPITDPAVLDGTENHPDFEWAWYQHSPELLPDGTLLLFDNGDNRNYTGFGPYSRVVQFRIDKDAMTVEQVWDYGTERGRQAFSRIVSDVDYHASERTVAFNTGAVQFDGESYGKTIEVDYVTRDVVFEATITPILTFFGIVFHRVERMPLYPQP